MTEEGNVARVKYDGPQREVRIRHVDGREFVVKKGETIECPSSMAESLLEQASWKKGSPAKKANGDAGGN